MLVSESICENCPPGYKFLLSADFNDEPLGKIFTKKMISFDFNKKVSMWSGADGTLIVGNGTNGSPGLTIKYPKGGYLYSDTQLFKVKFTPSVDVYMSYDVKFEPGFVFVKGGKLPGVCGGTCNTGGNAPNGNDGFSNRLVSTKIAGWL